jgi:hypothetical protein
LLEPEEISRLIGACRAAFDLRADAEITLETNPETATEAGSPHSATPASIASVSVSNPSTMTSSNAWAVFTAPRARVTRSAGRERPASRI